MKRLRVTMSARAVVAAGEPFSPRGGAYSDPGVALDEVLSLRASQEPLVLRVEATGGSPEDRARLAGDWLCDSGGEEPAMIPPARWPSRRVTKLWRKPKPLLDAWESHGDPGDMMAEASHLPLDRRSVVLAACACARLAYERWGEAVDAGFRALGVAEAWARGSANEADLEAAYLSCGERSSVMLRPSDAARCAVRCAREAASAGHWFEDYASLAGRQSAIVARGRGGAPSPDADGAVADEVRRRIPTVLVLRAAAAAARRAGGLPG